MSILNPLYPGERQETAYGIDYQSWYDRGKRAVLFDIDNTLVRHGAPADEKAVALFRKLHEIGYKTCLISNNKEPRVRTFAEQVDSQYLWKAGKPNPRGFETACAMMQVTPEQTLFVGDQLFTDIWGANRAAIDTVLVKPIHPKEEIQIILKRRLEWFVLKAYDRRQRLTVEKDK